MQRFWDKVEPIGDCLIWKGATRPNGYGTFRVGDHLVSAHRFAYKLIYDELPDDLMVCHSCDTKLCVNPEHLWLGTHSDNMLDAFSKKRKISYLKPAKGEDNGRHILTEQQVHEIKKKHTLGLGCRKLAREYNVGKSTIDHILNGTTWKHVSL